MRGGMAGASSVHEKENMQARGSGGKYEKGKERSRRSSAGSSARRLSVSGSKPRSHYLRVTNRFRRMGGCGRGRITAHRPVHFGGSPYEFTLRSDSEGDRRNSFVVFEDDVDSGRSKLRQLESATRFEASGTQFLPVAGFKNGRVENCRTPKTQGVTGEKNASRAPVQQGSKYHGLENFVAFRARSKSMFSSKLGPRPVAPLVEPANQRASGSRPCLETLAARWQRGGRRNLFTQRSLGTSELDDLEETFRKIDEEDLEKEMLEKKFEMEMHKYDLEDVMQPRDQREHEDLFVAVETSEAHETVTVPVEAQANVGDLVPEPFKSQEWELLSPRIGGLENEEGCANVDLTTPFLDDPKEKLRLDQTVPLLGVSPVNLELGVSPDASDFERAIKQLSPPAIHEQTPPASLPFSRCNNEDLDTIQQIPAEVESEIAQTVEAVQVWSVELDPSRRRRETMQCYSNRRSPWIKTLGLSSFQPANQLPDTTVDNVLRSAAMSMDHHDRVTPFSVSRPLPPLRLSEFVLNEPTKNLVESYEGSFLSTNLPSSSRKDLNGKEGNVEIIDSRFSTCPDHATADEFEVHIPSRENGQDMQALKDSAASLSDSRLSGPDESPVRPTDLSAECMGGLHEKASESSLEPPISQSAEPLGRVDDVEAAPSLVQKSFDTARISPTPPRNLSLIFGNPFGQMDGEELSRRWLQFCTTPPVYSDGIAGKKKSWNFEPAFAEPTCSEPTTSFPSEQVLERTTEADVLPIAEEDAVSSDGLHGKSPIQDEDGLPNAELEALSSDGSDGAMDYENDFNDISNDTTCIVQSGTSSADNDQEGTSALKECPEEAVQDAPIGEDMRCINLTPLRDNNFVEATCGPAVEYSLTHIDEGHIDQFVNALQVTPGVDESCVDRPTFNGEGASMNPTVDHNCQPPGDNAEQLNVNKELITPGKDGSRPSVEAQDECTPVQQKPKTKRTRKSTRIKKVDSPLDAGSKWSNGQRVSTRIKSKPLDWWRGERMLYGRVHSTLNTLIGIKHLSPDPVWPRPRDRKNKMEPPKFRVDSFVSDEHKELLRLAAQ